MPISLRTKSSILLPRKTLFESQDMLEVAQGIMEARWKTKERIFVSNDARPERENCGSR